MITTQESIIDQSMHHQHRFILLALDCQRGGFTLTKAKLYEEVSVGTYSRSVLYKVRANHSQIACFILLLTPKIS